MADYPSWKKESLIELIEALTADNAALKADLRVALDSIRHYHLEQENGRQAKEGK